ncbi:MAG: transposase [Erysipelotrichaceae bacterium]|nr:transposase [Erysipelotrichaceae bacterium]
MSPIIFLFLSLPDRKKGYLHHYFQHLQDSSELLNVKYVCMDMYLPYKQISKHYFKKALICVDSFHLIKHLNESLQKVRIRVLRSYDTDSIQYYLLKK